MSNTNTPAKAGTKSLSELLPGGPAITHVDAKRNEPSDAVQRATADAASAVIEAGGTDDEMQRAAADAASAVAEVQDAKLVAAMETLDKATQPHKSLREVKREQAAAKKAAKPAGHNPAPADVQRVLDQAAAADKADAEKGNVIDMAAKKAAKPAAKKAPAAGRTTPSKPAPAAKAAPAPAAKKPGERPAKKAAPAKAAPTVKKLPKAGKLTWEEKGDDGLLQANGARHQYRVKEGSAGGYFATQRLAKGGKWVHVAGRCNTVDEAKELAGYVEGGATWLSYQNMVGIPYAKVVETHK